MQIKYSNHIKTRLTLRKIEYDLPQRIYENSEERFMDTETGHATEEHIKGHQEEAPELYERFSEKLDRLLREYKENWEMLAKELEKLMEEIRRGRAEEETFGFDRKAEMPFLGLLKKEVFGVKNISDLNEKQVELLVQTTKDILERVKNEIKLVDFWGNYTAQKKLKGYIASHLLTAFKDNRNIFKNRAMLSQKILELAFHLHDNLTG